jgi:hypothetical protein
MHKVFSDNLKDAYGESKFVIAVNVDVRGFSTFSKQVESAESALYIKKIFIHLIKEYFFDSTFFTSTGDGLLVVFDVTEENLKQISRQVIQKSLNIVKNFSSICRNEKMINFKVPEKCGIGISRGPATCLKTESLILSYSGDALNTASRLMDCARPTGVVFDIKFGTTFLAPRTKELFQKNMIYLKGVSESDPMEIWSTKELTIISQNLKEPISNIKWESIIDKKKFKRIKQLNGKFSYRLEYKPINKDEISVAIIYPSIKQGNVLKGYSTRKEFKSFEYKEKADEIVLTVDFGRLIDILEKSAVKDNMNVEIVIKYPKK